MKRYLAAAAMAPLCFAAAPALAQTTISTSTTAPVATSTTGDLTISNTGSITVNDGAAVTVDTPATVTHSGGISIQNAPGDATGVLVTSGSGTINISGGLMQIGDTDLIQDTDSDGDNDGPFVTDTGARFGIHVLNPFTGNISQSSGLIDIKGNNSAAIAIDGPLTGVINLRGASQIVGANSFGIRTGGLVTGSVRIGGVLAQGENAVGVAIDGGVTGMLRLDGEIQTTGFRHLARGSQTFRNALDADDLLLGGPAVRIGGSIGGGILLDAAVPADHIPGDTDDDDDGTPDTTDTDDDNDGVLDTAETDWNNDGIADNDQGQSSITSYGSGPGMLIASPGAIVLGNVGAGPDAAYGLVIKGSLQGQGQFDGFSATGLELGGLGGTVDTGGGIFVKGVVAASSFGAASTAMRLRSGVTAPVLRIDGQVSASGNSAGDADPSATAVAIEAGASVPSLTVSGSLFATVNAENGQATAISDASGTLSQVTNTGIISAHINPGAGTRDPAATSVALDLSANTSGVTLVQSANSVATVQTQIFGDVLLGSGADSVQLNTGRLTGDLNFGAGAGSLLLDGDAIFTGGLFTTGPLSVDVAEGRLEITRSAALNLDTLNVGAESVLVFTLDPLNDDPTLRGTQLITNTATLADGVQLDIQFLSRLEDTLTVPLISALSPGGLVVGGLDESLLGDVPILFQADLTTSAQSVDVVVRRSTTDEIGLTGSQVAAFDALYNAFELDQGVRSAFFDQVTRPEFAELFDQFLPDYSGGTFQSMAAGARAVMRAEAENPRTMNAEQGRSWLQEVGFKTEHQGGPGEVGYESNGFGLAGGIERPDRGRGVFGFGLSFINADVDNANRRGDSLLTASAVLGSLYWRNEVGPLSLDAGVTGGFAWFDSDRNIIDLNDEGAQELRRQAGGEWSGGLLAARLGAVYERDFGRFYVRPEVSADVIYLYEGSYLETGGGPSVDLAVGSRSSKEASAEIGLALGARFGQGGFRWGPEFRVGYRSILADSESETTAQFAGAEDPTPFILRSLALDGHRLILRSALRGGSQYAQIAFEVTGELGDVYDVYEGRLVVRFLF